MKANKTVVRTRMAPSPTGEMHVGSMATLLKNFAWAKKHKGQFILRIEDTDKAREVAGGVDEILKIISDYGLDYDEGPKKSGNVGPYIQSQRLEIYQQKAQELVAKSAAYYCTCSKEKLAENREKLRKLKKPPKYDKHCRTRQAQVTEEIKSGTSSVIRLKVPDSKEVTFHDELRGDITVRTDHIDDQVLIKSDGFPTYHLAVVIDDHLMGITHILRGEEWISSTPKHIWLYQAFGWDQPQQMPKFVHLPVFLNPSGKGKMSKRQGTVSARSFLDKGYLPETMLNFFMLLGWASSDQREVLSLDEYIDEFDIAKLSKNPVVFDLKKLDWLNGVYIRKLSPADLKKRLQSFLPGDFPKPRLAEILPLVKERLVTLSDIESLTNYFYRSPQIEFALLLKRGDIDLVKTQLEKTTSGLDQVGDWLASEIEKVLRNLQSGHDWSKKQYFMMLRVAVTGQTATPPLFETMQVLGKNTVIKRLHLAEQKTL